MFVFLCFLAMCLIGESEGQNCTFPCNWQNKDFKWTIGDSAIGFWSFSENTFKIGGLTIECFKVVGRFLIVRRQDSGRLKCYVIETNNADSFRAVQNREIDELDFRNECSACSEPSGRYWSMSAVGTVAQNPTGAECTIPVGCTPGPRAKDPITCDDNGNIEGKCNEATTHPPPTISPATPPPKHCKQGQPYIR